MPPSGELTGSRDVHERHQRQQLLREVLNEPFFIFALGTALIMFLLAPFFAMANVSS